MHQYFFRKHALVQDLLLVLNLVVLNCYLKLFQKYFKWSGPVLEFKGSAPHVQKVPPTLVTQVDLLLQNRW